MANFVCKIFDFTKLVGWMLVCAEYSENLIIEQIYQYCTLITNFLTPSIAIVVLTLLTHNCKHEPVFLF